MGGTAGRGGVTRLAAGLQRIAVSKECVAINRDLGRLFRHLICCVSI